MYFFDLISIGYSLSLCLFHLSLLLVQIKTFFQLFYIFHSILIKHGLKIQYQGRNYSTQSDADHSGFPIGRNHHQNHITVIY